MVATMTNTEQRESDFFSRGLAQADPEVARAIDEE
jgi:hypothetical protein